MNDVQFRTMTREEVSTAVAWAANEGWNPGLSDAECFWPVDPEGFFCAETGGKIVGTVSVVNYDDRFAFGGFYIVDPEYRANGIGKQLCRYAMRHAGSRVVGIDGVVAMVEKYQSKMGLFLHYNNARYEGTGGGRMPAGLVPVRDVDIDSLIAFDAAHFPARRERFLRPWARQPGHSGFARLDGYGEILGYGIRRPCPRATRSGRSLQRTGQQRNASLMALLPAFPGNSSILISRSRMRTRSRS